MCDRRLPANIADAADWVLLPPPKTNRLGQGRVSAGQGQGVGRSGECRPARAYDDVQARCRADGDALQVSRRRSKVSALSGRRRHADAAWAGWIVPATAAARRRSRAADLPVRARRPQAQLLMARFLQQQGIMQSGVTPQSNVHGSTPAGVVAVEHL